MAVIGLYNGFLIKIPGGGIYDFTAGGGGSPTGPPSNNFSFSPTSGSPGTVVTFTANTLPGNFTGAIQADSGILADDGSGAINDGTIAVIDDTHIHWTVPADCKTGQCFVGNSFGYGFAGSPYTFTFIPVSPPSIPQNPSATADPSGGAVDLSWTASNNSPTHYNVQRSLTSGSGYATVGVPTATTYVDSAVTNGVPYYYVISATNGIGTSGNSTEVTATPEAPVAGSVTITVTPTTTSLISPYVYGINISAMNLFSAVATPTASITLDRLGGNRWTAYNWQTNYSNAGSDSGYTNDNQLESATTPLAALTLKYFNTDRSNGLACMMTIQVQGYVAADDSGAVSLTNPIQTSRFKTVVYAKGSAFTTTPNDANPSVYMDEFVWAMDQYYSGTGSFTNSPTVTPIFVQLDNEPDIWNVTHQEVQTSTVIPYNTFFTKSIAAATAIKNQFPQAQIVGPVISGFAQMYYWDGSWTGATTGGTNWLIDGYMAAFKTASTTYGSQLLNIFDFHWYTQVTVGGTAITSITSSSPTSAQITAIVNSPRSLYDSTYTETSYITADTNIGPINLIPRMLTHMAASGLSLNLAITEYYYGGANHVSGTIAQADVLGAYGAYGVWCGCMWPIQAAPWPTGGFRCFRNFDGAGANFGNTTVQAVSSNVANVQAYVSTDTSNPGRVVIVIINRSFSPQNVTIFGITLTGTAHFFQVTATSGASQGNTIAPVAAGTQSVSGTSNVFSVPSLSVTTIDCH